MAIHRALLDWGISISPFPTSNAFEVGNGEMLMPQSSRALCIAIGYKADSQSVGIARFTTGNDTKLNITLEHALPGKLQEILKPYEGYLDENSIKIDLAYM